MSKKVVTFDINVLFCKAYYHSCGLSKVSLSFLSFMTTCVQISGLVNYRVTLSVSVAYIE